MRSERDSFKRHAPSCRGGFRQVHVLPGDYWSGGDAHLFHRYAVTNGRWGAAPSMADGHDRRVAVRLNFLPELRVIVGIWSGLLPEDGPDAGHVLLKPSLDFLQQSAAAKETSVDHVNGL